MTSDAVYSHESYFGSLEALTPKDWMYKLSSTFPNGGVTNMNRVMQLEVISQLPKEAQKEQIRSVIEDMGREQNAYLANKHRQEFERGAEEHLEMKHSTAREIKAFL